MRSLHRLKREMAQQRVRMEIEKLVNGMGDWDGDFLVNKRKCWNRRDSGTVMLRVPQASFTQW